MCMSHVFIYTDVAFGLLSIHNHRAHISSCNISKFQQEGIVLLKDHLGSVTQTYKSMVVQHTTEGQLPGFFKTDMF